MGNPCSEPVVGQLTAAELALFWAVHDMAEEENDDEEDFDWGLNDEEPGPYQNLAPAE